MLHISELSGSRSYQLMTSPMEEVIAAAWKFAEDQMANFDGSHDLTHVRRVHRNALHIAKELEQRIDMTVVELAAILHDVGDHK